MVMFGDVKEAKMAASAVAPATRTVLPPTQLLVPELAWVHDGVGQDRELPVLVLARSFAQSSWVLHVRRDAALPIQGRIREVPLVRRVLTGCQHRGSSQGPGLGRRPLLGPRQLSGRNPRGWPLSSKSKAYLANPRTSRRPALLCPGSLYLMRQPAQQSTGNKTLRQQQPAADKPQTTNHSLTNLPAGQTAQRIRHFEHCVGIAAADTFSATTAKRKPTAI